MSSQGSRLPAERTETQFVDAKSAMSPSQAIAEANRCLYCHDAPCITACPTQIDVPEFIRKIATNNLKGSARTIFESNVLGMSCARVCPVEVLCAGACVYNEMDTAPIEIGRLQRFATDAAYASSWSFFEPGEDTGKSVGLVGGGPASLAVAHQLRRLGHACTIYEKRDVIGGLNTWGVAPYKMRADRALGEVDWVLQIGGIETRTGVEVGRDPSFGELLGEHDALFLGLGLGADQWLDIPGADLPGVHGAVAMIEKMKLGQVEVGELRHVAVIGGGNTALDVLRELLGLGVENVTMLYRRAEGDMSGYAHEWSAAKTAGARVLWRTMPVAFEGKGRLERVRATRLDETRQPIAGSEVELEADMALLAIGQTKLREVLRGLDGVELARGCIVVDERGATSRPGVFAAGDCVNGGKEVVNAVAEGKVAATGIDQYLRGDEHA